MKTYGDGGASRRSLRSARLSRADIGCTLAYPLLARRTCKRPVARSMSSQRSATSSEAERLIEAAKQNRSGHRDATVGRCNRPGWMFLSGRPAAKLLSRDEG